MNPRVHQGIESKTVDLEHAMIHSYEGSSDLDWGNTYVYKNREALLKDSEEEAFPEQAATKGFKGKEVMKIGNSDDPPKTIENVELVEKFWSE
ncbi:hypothetical protein Fmac_001278 [Flemingia macrophylla]|uniref:Uncharacterized protein n=1 Tax=Flemingia macrophylla TaxID=520843 RepID=A0ABD1NGM2_9FABA